MQKYFELIVNTTTFSYSRIVPYNALKSWNKNNEAPTVAIVPKTRLPANFNDSFLYAVSILFTFLDKSY